MFPVKLLAGSRGRHVKSRSEHMSRRVAVQARPGGRFLQCQVQSVEFAWRYACMSTSGAEVGRLLPDPAVSRISVAIQAPLY